MGVCVCIRKTEFINSYLNRRAVKNNSNRTRRELQACSVAGVLIE